jgi:hypothetical protein
MGDVAFEDLTPKQRSEMERIVQWAHEPGLRPLEERLQTPDQAGGCWRDGSRCSAELGIA